MLWQYLKLLYTENNAMNNLNPCMTAIDLRDYVSGWSDATQIDVIERHLLDCEACEQTILKLESEPDTMVDIVRRQDVKSHVQHDPSEPDEAASVDEAVAYALHRAKETFDVDSSSANQFSVSQEMQSIGPYEIIRKLGQGGMGAVYLARHCHLDKQVAVKLLPIRRFEDDQHVARFQREILAAGKLEHPAIIHATDAGQAHGVHYLVMQFIDGFDLSRIARLSGQLSVADVCAIGKTIASGLSYAHATGVVHRDIKPSNVMLSRSGEVKILDFGLAQMGFWDSFTADLTTVGQLMGTLDYMAPEQAERAAGVDYRADLYSLGATLFRLLCGRPPLAASPDLSPLTKLRMLDTHEPPRLETLRPDVPVDLANLVAELLSRQPADRPASAAHVAERLAPLAGDSRLDELVTRADQALQEIAAPRASEERVVSLPSENKIAVEPEPAFSGRGRYYRNWFLAAAMLPLLIFGGVLLALETQKGQLVIESESASVTVNLLQDGKVYDTLEVVPGTETTRLYAGQYEIVLDAASDRFAVENSQFSIRQGETIVARVKTQGTTETIETPVRKSQTVLPSSTTPIQPGEELRLVSQTEHSIDTTVIVMADSTIKVPLVGVVSTDGETLTSLEKKLTQALSAWIKKPQLEVYRTLRETNFLAGESGAMSASSGPFVAEEKTSAVEPTYAGKSVFDWLSILEKEHDPTMVTTALNALKSLASTQNSNRLQARLMPIVRSQLGKFPSPHLRLIFETLAKTEPNLDERIEFVIGAMADADPALQMELLQRGFYGFDTNPNDMSLVFEKILSGDEPMYRKWDRKAVAEFARRYLERDDLLAEDAEKLMVCLNALELETTFWLRSLVNKNNYGEGRSSQWQPQLVAAVVDCAVDVAIERDGSKEELFEATIILTDYLRKNPGRTTSFPRRAELEEAMRERILAFADNTSDALATVALDMDLVRNGARQTLQTLSHRPNRESVRQNWLRAFLRREPSTCIAFETIALSKEMQISDRLSDAYGRFASSLVPTVADSISAYGNQWFLPSEIDENRGKLPLSEIGESDRSDVLTMAAYSFLLLESAMASINDLGPDLKQKAIRSMFDSTDTNSDGRLSLAELGSSNRVKFNAVSASDAKDGIDFEEFTRLVEPN
jgi:serine/threonine protein kinase